MCDKNSAIVQHYAHDGPNNSPQSLPYNGKSHVRSRARSFQSRECYATGRRSHWLLGVCFSLLAGEYHTFSTCISVLLTVETSTHKHTHTHTVYIKPDVERLHLNLKRSLTIEVLRCKSFDTEFSSTAKKSRVKDLVLWHGCGPV